MTVSFATFDRLKSKGVASYQNGDYLAARTYLVDAAGCMLDMAAASKTADARRQHEELAAELIALAKDCDRLRGGHGATKLENGVGGAARSADNGSRRTKQEPTPPIGSSRTSPTSGLTTSPGWRTSSRKSALR